MVPRTSKLSNPNALKPPNSQSSLCSLRHATCSAGGAMAAARSGDGGGGGGREGQRLPGEDADRGGGAYPQGGAHQRQVPGGAGEEGLGGRQARASAACPAEA
eukprot:203685-Hanusia_phi.AAC.1